MKKEGVAGVGVSGQFVRCKKRLGVRVGTGGWVGG